MKPSCIHKRQNRPQTGFTLEELLIALMILGEIATFTIPKILAGQTTSRNNAVAKEAMATLASAYQQFQMAQGTVPTSTTPGALTQYMNYVSYSTSGTIDLDPFDTISIPAGTYACSASYPCMKLHNGSTVMLLNASGFGTTSGVVAIIVDPDTAVTNKSDSIVFYLFYNGRVTSLGQYMSTTSYDPSWFSL